MKYALFAFSSRGCQTARRVMDALDGEIRAYTMRRLEETGFLSINARAYGDSFAWADGLIFVGACGIAVRKIAPFVHDKRTDPAVICVDELGQFVIPLLSGHIGGANALAKKIAQALGATPVITTATDINGKFSVDAWAARNGCAISSMAMAKAVSAGILERNIPMKSDFPIATKLAPGVMPGDGGDLGIYVTFGTDEPFAKTLRLVPKILHLGIGCRRGTPKEKIAAAVNHVLEEKHIDPHAIKCAASIDLKSDEQGLLDYCKEAGFPIFFYSADELRGVKGEFSTSEFVLKTTGVDNVCQRSAMVGADTIIVKKTALDCVTVAVGAEHWEVHFE